MNNLFGTQKKEEVDTVSPKQTVHAIPIPVPKPAPNPVALPPKIEPMKTEEMIPVSLQPNTASVSHMSSPIETETKQPVANLSMTLRIEKIEIPHMAAASSEEGEENFEEEENRQEYVLFRIYSPYYEVYETLLTQEYLKNIGLSTLSEGMSGGGNGNPTFPYSLFRAVFDNTFGRLSYLFQPKKENLADAEERLKQSDTLLSQVSQFNTDELLKPLDEKTPVLDLSSTFKPVEQEYVPDREQPPYFEIKLPKVGPVLTLKEYNEQKRQQTRDDILEHDETGKTFQEILLEAKQDEIQQERKHTLLSVLEQNTQNENLLQAINQLEKEDVVNDKIWFIQQVDDEGTDTQMVREPVYKTVKLNLSLVAVA